MRTRNLMMGSVLVLAAASAASADRGKTDKTARLNVSSSAFIANGDIPRAHTCDGAGMTPPLTWSKPPSGTRSVAILVEDPDAPKKTFTHWLVTGLPAGTTSLSEGAKLPEGATAMKSDGGKAAWTPPCPPNGRHHYVFHVYALDTSLGKRELSRTDFLSAIEGHVLAQGTLVGMYQR